MKILALFVVIPAMAQTLAPPRIGLLRDSSGGYRELTGVAGSFVFGAPLAAGVEAAAFAGAFGFRKTAGGVTVFDADGAELASVQASTGPVRFGFLPGGAPALVWIENEQQLLLWRDHGFTPVPHPDPGGRVLAIAALSADGFVWIVARENGLRRIEFEAQGHTRSDMPLSGPVRPVDLAPDGSVVDAAAMALPGAAQNIERISADWWVVRGEGFAAAVRIRGERTEVYELQVTP